jgi:hypothetical protein
VGGGSGALVTIGAPFRARLRRCRTPASVGPGVLAYGVDNGLIQFGRRDLKALTVHVRERGAARRQIEDVAGLDSILAVAVLDQQAPTRIQGEITGPGRSLVP